MASHAHSTRTSLLRQTTGSAGLLPAGSPSVRIVAAGGPITRALAVMATADPDLARIRNLRRSIAMRIEADIALLDALAGDTDLEENGDLEPSLCGCTSHTFGEMLLPSEGGDDREGDAGDEPEDENEHGSAEDHGEPSLGSLDAAVSQARWGAGNRSDREAGDDNGMADSGGMYEQIVRYLSMGGDMTRLPSGMGR